MKMTEIIVVGGGLAGCEASYYLANQGFKVLLYEMRPNSEAKAHHSAYLGELVCSNSLKSESLTNASGLLKEEMKQLNSLLMQCAEKTRVKAGQALAVDRESFAKMMNDTIEAHPNIQVIREEIKIIPKDRIVIIASGPLTSNDLSKDIAFLLGEKQLYFYDAAAPLIEVDSINMGKAYCKSRYDKGEADYINCPFTKEEFFIFYNELIAAKRVELKEFEKELHFEACMPIETLASRGHKTLLFGPMKPVGLENRDGKRPFAVVQLRFDDVANKLCNLVGFQTNLMFPDQNRVFRLIPGLEQAKFARYGVMHRNTYICSPKHLLSTLQLKKNLNIFLCGQITGVEGYIESAASGMIAAINCEQYCKNQEIQKVPNITIIGALIDYISSGDGKNFQPMNSNYGILKTSIKDKEEVAKNSLQALKFYKESLKND